MSSPTQRPSLEDVLGAFSVEPSPGRETLERYLRRYPEFAWPLVDLSRELHRALPDFEQPDTPEDEARIDAAWHRHIESVNPEARTDLFAALSTQQLRDLSKALDVPRQVITAFRERRVILDSVPRYFLSRLAAALNQTLERLATNLAPFTQPFAQSALARSHKSDVKPAAGEPVTLERLLIDAGVPEDKRARILADYD
jgi:hypothetical protein